MLPTSATGAPIKSGLVLKKSDHLKVWHDRFVAVYPGLLLYWASKENCITGKPHRGSVVLSPGVDIVSSGYTMGRFMFDVVLPSSTLRFAVESEGERNLWALALRAAGNPASSVPQVAVARKPTTARNTETASAPRPATLEPPPSPFSALPTTATTSASSADIMSPVLLTSRSETADPDRIVCAQEGGNNEAEEPQTPPPFIPDVSGVWEADLARSDSLDPMFQLMGLNWMLRRIACSISAVSTYTHDLGAEGRPPSLTNVSVTPVGSETKRYVLDGRPQEIKGADGKVRL
jgi:hypothetical protein